MFLTISSLSIEICVFDMLFDNFELRDRYGDVGHYLLVQEAPGLIQKYLNSIHVWSLFVFAYIQNKCTLNKKCQFVIDFHVLALPGYSRAHNDVRLEKSVPTAPISSSSITL
jgi:hypothetical protein